MFSIRCHIVKEKGEHYTCTYMYHIRRISRVVIVVNGFAFMFMTNTWTWTYTMHDRVYCIWTWTRNSWIHYTGCWIVK